MLNVNDISKRLGVHYNTVYYFIHTGELKAYKLKRDYRIKEEDFQKFMDERNRRVKIKVAVK